MLNDLCTFEISASKAITEYQEYVEELQTVLKQPCPSCGKVTVDDSANGK